MRISVAVMAHPSRALQAKALERQLSAMAFSDVYTIYDEINEEWDTGSRAWRWGVGRADWHLVIQDDAVLTPYFYENCEAMIRALPVKSVVSLYTGKVRPLPERVTAAVAKAPDGTFLQHYMLMWGVGILIPSDHIPHMLDFLDEPKYNDTKYDIRIGIFYQRNRLPIYYSMPSLVDHNDDLGSLIGNGYDIKPRVAHRRSRGLVSWTGSVVNI